MKVERIAKGLGSYSRLLHVSRFNLAIHYAGEQVVVVDFTQTTEINAHGGR